MLVSPWGASDIPLPDIKDNTEEARAIWISTDGFVCERGDETHEVSVPVATAVTDRRLLFLTRGETRGQPDEVYPLWYDEIASVDVEAGQLLVRSTDNEVYRVAVPDNSRLAPVLAHLRWVGRLRSHLVSLGNDVELAAGEIRENAYSLDWGPATETYEDSRRRLDELTVAVQLVDPVATHHLAPELTGIERTLEQAHARLYIERAKSALSLGRHLVENEEFERARTKLKEAHGYYGDARQQSDAVRRGDAFQFGPQRELQEDLESLSWEIETVTAEPIRKAHEAKTQAQSEDEPGEALSHWERAFEWYGNVLTLDWEANDQNFAGDPAEVRADRLTAARRIVELRDDIARDAWDRGARHQRAGEYEEALDCCLAAIDHLQRVREVTRTCDLGETDTVEGRLDQMREVVGRLREERRSESETGRETGSDDRGEKSASTTPDETAGSFDEGEIPSVSELSQIDTHHDITLDLGDPAESEDGEAEPDQPDEVTGGLDSTVEN